MTAHTPFPFSIISILLRCDGMTSHMRLPWFHLVMSDAQGWMDGSSSSHLSSVQLSSTQLSSARLAASGTPSPCTSLYLDRQRHTDTHTHRRSHHYYYYIICHLSKASKQASKAITSFETRWSSFCASLFFFFSAPPRLVSSRPKWSRTGPLVAKDFRSFPCLCWI